ncbi:MAG: hypothetical protein RJB26_1030 [Pseudomonadota bacterium]
MAEVNRILTAEEVGGAATLVEAWTLPDVAPRFEPAPQVPPIPENFQPHAGGGIVTASVLDDLQHEAWREGFVKGQREGEAAGLARLARQVEQVDLLLTDLARPFTALDEQVASELLALAVALARQLVRRELRQDPMLVMGVVREALSMLPAAARDIRVQVHPEDAAVIRANLAPTAEERVWSLQEDPMMMRGGCQVVSVSSRVDARLEQRLGTLLAELLGDERQQPRHGAGDAP